MALAIHGAPRATQDIDLLLRPEDMDRLREAARARGFVVSREGLIALKLAAGRPQDLPDVQRLEEVARG